MKVFSIRFKKTTQEGHAFTGESRVQAFTFAQAAEIAASRMISMRWTMIISITDVKAAA